MSDFRSQIGTLIFKVHAPKQRPPVLFRARSSQIPPVIKLSTINNLYVRNRKKPLQNTTESITQYSYRAYPPAKRINKKLEKVKRENTAPPPPFQSYRTRQNRAKKTENPYSPATHTSKVPTYTRTGPALHTAETHTCEYVRDPARQRNSHEPSTPN